jgi:hypothetical protein
MATNYPGSLDSWTNPTNTTAMNAPGFEHDVLHANAYDAIEAIEGELGTDPAGGAATVKARLDGIARRHLRWPTTGYYYRGQIGYDHTNGQTVTANRLYYTHFYCPTSVTIAALAVEVTTAATGDVRLGIYNASWGSTGLVPTTRVVDAGTASTASTTGFKEVASSQALLGDTWYFLAGVFSGTPSVRVGSSWGPMAVDSSNTALTGGVVYETFTYGALPASAGTLTVVTTSTMTGFAAVKL